MSEKETIQFDAQVDKIFHLMIHALYEKKEIFLRELLSNASDACDKLRYKAIETPDLLDENLHIDIIADAEKKTLTIRDNGIGMSKEEMIQNLGTIARSGTQNFLDKLTGDNSTDAQLIGQFGVGFYSAFMVADTVEVISRAAGADDCHLWTSKGTEGGKFTVEAYDGDHGVGTSVILHLKEDEKEYLDQFRVGFIVETYSNYVPFDIYWIETNGERKKINDATALWMKNKSEISDEDYDTFYKSVTHGGFDSKPWMVLHNRAEGTIEYTNLLFIPTMKPMDLYNPERKTQVKLFINRVFIADDGLEIIPSYLRFLRGVIDSSDLPLNISRETVQNNRTVQKIRRGLTKKIISELTKKAEKEPEEYKHFWENFGSVLKEGLCDGMEPRNDLIEACRFKSTLSGPDTIGLKQYVERMKDGQDTIYFITGPDDSIINSPQLEGFKAKGIEVLLLSDSVDEFWVNVLHAYQDYDLKSVTRAGNDLDTIGKKDEDISDDTEKDDADKTAENAKINDKDPDTVLDFIKATLGDSISDARTTSRLNESPVCLAVPEGMMDIRMERFMVENKQLPQVTAKILEINPNHPIITQLARDIDSGDQSMEKLTDTVHLLFAQANIIEGEPVNDAATFAQRLNRLLQAGQAA